MDVGSSNRSRLVFLDIVLHIGWPSNSRLCFATIYSPLAAARSERNAKLHIPVREIQDRLRKTGRLHNTPYLDSSFVFDQFADCSEECGGELW